MTKKNSHVQSLRVGKDFQKRDGYGSSSKKVSALKPPPAGAAPGGSVRPSSRKSA